MAAEPDGEKLEAEPLLDQHASGHAAHIFADDQRVATIRRPERALAMPHPPLQLASISEVFG